MLPQEAIGEYRVILDEMAAAMNDTAEAVDDASRLAVEKPKRASVRKYNAEMAAPVERGAG
jgi:hypothetical protein